MVVIATVVEVMRLLLIRERSYVSNLPIYAIENTTVVARGCFCACTHRTMVVGYMGCTFSNFKCPYGFLIGCLKCFALSVYAVALKWEKEVGICTCEQTSPLIPQYKEFSDPTVLHNARAPPCTSVHYFRQHAEVFSQNKTKASKYTRGFVDERTLPKHNS